MPPILDLEQAGHSTSDDYFYSSLQSLPESRISGWRHSTGPTGSADGVAVAVREVVPTTALGRMAGEQILSPSAGEMIHRRS